MNTLKHLRLISFLEGCSYVLLLCVAMPLKYLADMPLAVRVTGSAHGFLFMLFLLALFRAATDNRWSLLRALTALVACLTPFAAFVFDRSLKREIDDAAAVPAEA